MRVSESFVATCGPPPSPPFGISGPKQSAASRGEIKRNVRFDGGSDDARPNGRRREGSEGGKIPRAMSEMRLRAMPCHPYLMAQFMVQDGSGRQGADRAPHNIKCERSLYFIDYYPPQKHVRRWHFLSLHFFTWTLLLRASLAPPTYPSPIIRCPWEFSMFLIRGGRGGGDRAKFGKFQIFASVNFPSLGF